MMYVDMPEGEECPDGCSGSDGDSCKCESLNLFDPGAQLSKLFEEA